MARVSDVTLKPCIFQIKIKANSVIIITNLLYNFINETTNKWDISIVPEISNLMELVSTKNLFVNKIDEVFQKTNDDGYTEMKPISFDYRISNDFISTK